MSASSSFKQECPFCEALVLIRDPKSIGKNVKCPKCEGRFVAKAPADEPAELEEIADAPKKKPKSAEKGKPGAKTPGKGKKKPSGDDLAASKKKKKSTMLLVGGGLGLAGLVLLIVVFFSFSGSPPTPPPQVVVTPPPVTPPPIDPQPENKNEDGKQADNKNDAASTEAISPTLFLPASATSVFSVNVDRVRECGGLIAAMQSPGAFQKDAFEKTFGFPFLQEKKGVSRIVTALNSKERWVFSVLRTRHAVDQADLIKRLRLKSQDLQGKRYYLIDGPLDGIGTLLFKANQAHETFALCFVDSHTIVFADVEPLKKFMQERLPQLVAHDRKPMPMPDYGTLKKELAEVMQRVDQQEAPAILCMGGEVEAVWAGIRPLIEHLAKHGAQIISNAIAKATATLPIEDAVIKEIRRASQNPDPGLQKAEAFLIDRGPNGAIALVGMTEKKLSLAVAYELKGDALANSWIKGYLNPLRDLLLAAAGVDPAKPDAPYNVGNAGRVISATMAIPLGNQAEFDAYRKDLTQGMIRARTVAELASTAPRYHQLAAALSAYAVKNNGQYPRGTVRRTPSLDADGDFRAPNNRVSWLAELLPFFTDSAVSATRIDFDRDWNQGDNLAASYLVIPQFVVRSPGAVLKTTYPTLPGEFGVSHFIGMAGLGLDAASYPKDPAHAAKVGIFGYDRVTERADISPERADKVIALIQVSPEYYGPWLAGGGGTVRGVSEDARDALQPFMAADYKGKRGTFAIMADFRVRFIPATIDPKLFQSLCVIQGPNQIDNFDTLVPLVPDEDLVDHPMAGMQEKAPAMPPKPAPAPEKPAAKPTGEKQ